MANQAINGKVYVLQTQTGTGSPAAFETVVCLTNTGFTVSDNPIDTASKCDDGWESSIAGNKGWSFSGTAQSIAGTPDAGTASFKKYLNLWKAETKFNAQLVNIDDEDDIVRGLVRISAISFTGDNNAVATFDLTLTGQGEFFTTAAA